MGSINMSCDLRHRARAASNRVWPAALALLFVLWCAAGDGRAAPSPTEGTVRVGDMAPNFTLATLGGGQITLSDHLGTKPVLLVFWSYFCLPCQRELPDLQGFLRESEADGVDMIGICLDGPQYSDRLVPFAQKNGITFPLAYDRETEEFFEVAERYGVVGTPTSFLLDSAGRVRLVHLGRVDRDLLVAGVKAAKEKSYCSEIIKPTPAAKSEGTPTR